MLQGSGFCEERALTFEIGLVNGTRFRLGCAFFLGSYFCELFGKKTVGNSAVTQTFYILDITKKMR